MLFEESPDGVLVRPAAAVPVEVYDPERRAAFLLENAVDDADYARARQEVVELGLDPEDIPHDKADRDRWPSLTA